MSQRELYTKQKLYEEAFNVSFDWEKFLSPKCYEFHDLTCRETNSPISLQMGVMLPFVAACLGPSTRGNFLTRPSVLNLFWLNVAASGVGKVKQGKGWFQSHLNISFHNQTQNFKTLKCLNSLEQVSNKYIYQVSHYDFLIFLYFLICAKVYDKSLL